MQRRRRHEHHPQRPPASDLRSVPLHSLTFMRPGSWHSTWRLIHPGANVPDTTIDDPSPLPIPASPSLLSARELSPCNVCGEASQRFIDITTVEHYHKRAPSNQPSTRTPSRSPRRHQQHLLCVSTRRLSVQSARPPTAPAAASW